MARRPGLIKRKPKVTRVTRSETYIVNSKYLGDEPSFNTVVMTAEQYSRSLSWYNIMCSISDAREYIENYLQHQNRNEEITKLAHVSDTWISTTAGWIARMLTKGNLLPDSAKPFFEKKLQESFSHISAKQDIKVEFAPAKPSIQDRMQDKASELIGDIEQLIDSNASFSLFDYLKAKQIPATYYPTAIVNHYAPWLGELLEASENQDVQLKEAYSHLNKKQLRDRINLINMIITDAEKYAGVVKKTRAPRKPRAVSAEKKLKYLKFQKESPEYKIASIDPEKIFGASELWTFNTKYKIITVFRALDRGGLQVNRSSIIGFNSETSISKGTGRQAQATLDKLAKGGKLVLKKLMDELKTDKNLQERINENTILIKVIA